MEKPNQLTRTCSACGKTKSLTAFLQISGDKGSSYGNICGACRGTAGTTPVETATDERDTGSTRFRIAGKEKVQSEIAQKREQQRIKDLHRKELQRNERRVTEKTQRADSQGQAEKDHRERFLDDKKKQGFLNYRSQKTPLSPQSILAEKAQRERLRMHTSFSEQGHIETKKQEATAHEEATIAATDPNAAFSTTQFTDARHNTSSLFNQYIAWLGPSAPRSAPLLLKTLQQENQNKKAFLDSQHHSTKNPSAAHQEKDPLVEFPEKTWGPSSRRR